MLIRATILAILLSSCDMANFPKKIHFKHTFNESPGFFPIEGTENEIGFVDRSTLYRYGVSTPFNISKVGSLNSQTFRLYPYWDGLQEVADRFRFCQTNGYLFGVVDLIDGWPYLFQDEYGPIPGQLLCDVYQIDIINLPTVPHPPLDQPYNHPTEFWISQGLFNGVNINFPYSFIPNSGYEVELVPLLKNSNFSHRFTFDPGVDHFTTTTANNINGDQSTPYYYSSSKERPWSDFSALEEPLPPITPEETFLTGVMYPSFFFVTATVEQLNFKNDVSFQNFSASPGVDNTPDSTYIQDINGNYFYAGPNYESIPSNKTVKLFKVNTIYNGPEYTLNGATFGNDYGLSFASASVFPDFLGLKFSSYQNPRLQDGEEGQYPIADLFYESTANQFEVGDRVHILVLRNSGFILDDFSITSNGTYIPSVNYNPDMKINLVDSYCEFIFNAESFNDFELIFETVAWDKNVGYECEVNTTSPYEYGYVTEFNLNQIAFPSYAYQTLESRNYIFSQINSLELSSPSISSKIKKPSSTKSCFSVPQTCIKVVQGTLEPYIGSISTLASNRFKLKEYEIYGGSTNISGWKVGNL